MEATVSTKPGSKISSFQAFELSPLVKDAFQPFSTSDSVDECGCSRGKNPTPLSPDKRQLWHSYLTLQLATLNRVRPRIPSHKKHGEALEDGDLSDGDVEEEEGDSSYDMLKLFRESVIKQLSPL